MVATFRSVRKKRRVNRPRAFGRFESLERRELLSGSPWGSPDGDAPTLEERYDYFIDTGFATDSASAATAMSTGQKTDSGNIAWLPGDPDDGAVTTIGEQLRKEQGFAMGVVSTVPFNHATPAAFASHNISRNNYAPGKMDEYNPMTPSIAEEILLETQPDVVIGGGYGSKYVRGLDSALEQLRTGDEYVTVERSADRDGGKALAAAADQAAQEGKKLFGLFGTPSGNFEYYTVADNGDDRKPAPEISRGQDGIDPDPTLADATAAALHVLSQDRDGFFLMIEQGDIDWSNHANRYDTMIGGVYDLEQAVQTAETYVNQPGDKITWKNTLMIVTSDHSNSYMRNLAWSGKGDLPDQIAMNGEEVIPGVTQVSYSSGGHTNELVNLYAYGKGANLFKGTAGSWYRGTQIVDNTQIYDVMAKAAKMGVDHILLFIGDGMNVEHEMAGSRYLYGRDFGLAWHDWGFSPRGWSGFAATWDVSTYDRYAGLLGAEAYDPNSFDPAIGYDPAQGGSAPYPVDTYLGYLATRESGRRLSGSLFADLAVVRQLVTPGHGPKHFLGKASGCGAGYFASRALDTVFSSDELFESFLDDLV
jgi:alkaline phosphatase